MVDVNPIQSMDLKLTAYFNENLHLIVLSLFNKSNAIDVNVHSLCKSNKPRTSFTVDCVSNIHIYICMCGYKGKHEAVGHRKS